MANKINIDATDRAILDILKHNARIQWREIGEQIHMTGQAVGDRVRKLKIAGIITGFSTDINLSQIGETTVNYITVIMSTNDHKGFLKLTQEANCITEVYRTSGHGCYLLRTETTNQDSLEQTLERILVFGNYQINSVLSRHK